MSKILNTRALAKGGDEAGTSSTTMELNFFQKFKFLLKKPKVIIVTGEGRFCAKEAIQQVLKPHFSVGKEILVLESDLKNTGDLKRYKFLINQSSLVVLVVTHAGDIPLEQEFFAAEREKTKEILSLAKILPSSNYLVLNFDDETVREIGDLTNLKTLNFGFQERADLRASDIKINGGTNFKINYKGNIVPVWLERLFGKEQIYSALAGVALGIIFDLNLVEISQALKNYQSLPGRMRLIAGRNNSQILDDSATSAAFSMVEAVEILGKIHNSELHRRIVVLGDVVGIGKYTIEAHEAIGEKVANNADLLFTIGQRARFIAEGAKNKGMPVDKILQYDTIDEGKLKLKDEIKSGDLILVDGSKEMKMEEIVEQIKEGR